MDLVLICRDKDLNPNLCTTTLANGEIPFETPSSGMGNVPGDGRFELSGGRPAECPLGCPAIGPFGKNMLPSQNRYGRSQDSPMSLGQGCELGLWWHRPGSQRAQSAWPGAAGVKRLTGIQGNAVGSKPRRRWPAATFYPTRQHLRDRAEWQNHLMDIDEFQSSPDPQ